MSDAPRIWTRRPKIQEPNREIVATVRPEGRYRLRAVRPDGRMRSESPWFDNLILDSGLDRIGTNDITHSTCAVGTGTTPPVVANTQLENFLASTTSIQSTVNATSPSSPYFVRKTWTYRFGQGAAAGNLTEVGVGWAASSMFSRALIEDSEGDPTTFTVLADEFLDVVYQLTCFAPLVDVVDAIDISGNSHDIVLRAANAATATGNGWRLDVATSSSRSFTGGGAFGSAYDGAIGPITGQPSGTTSPADSAANASYTPGNFYRDFTVTWGLNAGNVGGITSVRADMCSDVGNDRAAMNFQVSFDPVIDKDATKLLTLTFRHQWARAA